MQMSIFERIDSVELAAEIERLLQSFEADPKSARCRLASICVGNPSLFFGIAFRKMSSLPAGSAAARSVSAMAIEDRCLLPLFEEREGLTFEEGKLLVRRFTEGKPGLENALLESYLPPAKEGILPDGLFLVLDLIVELDGVGRSNSLLVRFLRSPNAKIRSRVAESLLKITKSAETAASLLADPDNRVRANVIEGLWSQSHSAPVQQLLREHVESPVPRIALNALIGLCRAGDAHAAPRIAELAMLPNPPMQRAAVWAMGHLALKEFMTPLRELLRSGDTYLRGNILRALVRINDASKRKAHDSQGVYAANTAIGKILLAGPTEWNRWRRTCNEPRPSLEGDSFYQLDLTGADLSYCCLRGADFEKAALNLCNLYGADLRDANFRGAKLNRADLRNTQVSAGTSFGKAGFRGACLPASILRVANIGSAPFDPAVVDMLENTKAAEVSVALPETLPAA
ncbi:MAG: HEAT repeat domain-containing protein [Bryobacterales bacterium]|nr:HEAT repeat domain-containing protein [Bryobacterales bacterium]